MKATKNRERSDKAKLEDRKLTMNELEGIIERAGSVLSDEEREKLRATVETLAWLQVELGKRDMTVARLRSMLGVSTSERAKRILSRRCGDGGSSGDQVQGTGSEGEASSSPSEPPKAKPRGHGRNWASSYESADHVPVGHPSLSSGDPCPSCPTTHQGTVYTQGRPRTIVHIVGKPPLEATVYELERLRCNLCGQIFTPDPPPGVGDSKYAATAIAMILLLKYGCGFPFNRLQRLEGDVGVPLPSSTQWDLVSTAADDVKPVYDELVRQAAQGHVLHNDDTSMRVLGLRKAIDELVASGDTKRTGIFSTGVVSELTNGYQAALYFTGREHAGENIAALLAQREASSDVPIQMCDGLGHNLPKDFQTIVANCLVHARRKFVEVVNTFPDEVRYVIETLSEVYRNEAKTREQGLSPEDRLRFHQEHSGPLMDALATWMEQQFSLKLVEPNSGLGAAIRYMQKRWTKLTLFLQRPGAPLDNNSCERALKKAILNRRNALFYKTENGARVGDCFMALIHTAELAKANPFEYLTALLDNRDAIRAHPDQWLPWNYRETLGTDGREDAAAAG